MCVLLFRHLVVDRDSDPDKDVGDDGGFDEAGQRASEARRVPHVVRLHLGGGVGGQVLLFQMFLHQLHVSFCDDAFFGNTKSIRGFNKLGSSSFDIICHNLHFYKVSK